MTFSLLFGSSIHAYERVLKAESHIDTYLSFDLSDYHKGYGQCFKGHIHYRQKQYRKAKNSYDNAWNTNKVKGSKESSKCRQRNLLKENNPLIDL